MNTQLKKIAVGLMAAVACSTLMSQKASAQTYDQVVNVSFMREGIGPYSNANGVGAAVDSGTIWNDQEVGAGFVGANSFSPLVNSNGGATGLTFNTDWGFISNNGAALNGLNQGYYYEGRFIGGSAIKPYSIDGLDIGKMYDLFFYLGNSPPEGTGQGITVDATGGVVAPDSDTGSGYSNDLGIASPTHADWIEGAHYEKLTVTTTAATVSGEFTLADVGGGSVDADNRFYGVQIARTVPIDLQGDFNGDTVIDSVDAGILRDHMLAHLDGGVTYENGDFNFDGRVDLNDFRLFLEVFPGAAAAVTVVPEPSSVGLSLAALAGLVAVARRRGR